MKNVILLLCIILSCTLLVAQSQYEGLCCPHPPGQGPTPTSYEIYEDILKLSNSKSVLYIAAHPDDENTNLIAYLSNHLKVNTSYLSLTRGDGGQNRIGSELREQLGVIRTQELLNARAVDGGHQFFSRANDFGYSKSPDETLEIWEEDKLLEDIVWVIRKVRPEVIINRFDHRTPGTTHGHHTASAILSVKAFDMAGDKNVFPEQLKYVSVFQPKRLFLNQSSWFYDSDEEFEKAMSKNDFVKLDVGVHYYGKGISNNQMAANSRTQHRCQGMGTTPKLGKHFEYLELIKGQKLSNGDNLFSEKNLEPIQKRSYQILEKIIKKITSEYNFSTPYNSLPDLVQLYQQTQKNEDGQLSEEKLTKLKKIIFDCANLHFVPLAESATYIPGDTISIDLEMVNQSPTNIKLVASEESSSMNIQKTELPFNESKIISSSLIIPENATYDNPYWLEEKASLGMYNVPAQKLRGLPETPNQLSVNVLLEIAGAQIPYSFPIAHKFTDPVVGQIYEPVKVTPPVFLELEESVYIFPDDAPQIISVEVSAGTDGISGTLFPGHQKGWSCSPDSVQFNLAKKGMSQSFEFQLTPPKEQQESILRPYIQMDGKQFDKTRYDIRYQHIPRQLVFLEAAAKAVKIDLKTKGKNIAYLMGAGDGVAEQLRQIGYEVT
ncbi:MAG: PIG-L family deacetylase, partial [Saprospiraceae bacterium]